MASFTIYDARYEPLVSFSPEKEEMGDAVTIGASGKCKVSLADFPEVAETIRDMHFSILRKGGKWFAVNPGNDLRLPDGHRVEELELRDGMEVVFGACRMKAVLDDSTLELAWPASREEIARAPIMASGTTLVGSAKYCDVVIDSPAVASEHARISRIDDKLFIEDVDSNAVVKVGGKNVLGKTAIAVDELFHLGKLPAKVVPAEFKDSEISFSRANINWRAVNILLFLALALATAFLLWGGFDAENAKPKTDEVALGTREGALKEIAKALAEGADEVALARLENARRLFPKEEFDALEKALSLEAAAARSVSYYASVLGELLNDANQMEYVRNAVRATDGHKTVALDLDFWKTSKRKLLERRRKLSEGVAAVFAKYGFKTAIGHRFDDVEGEMDRLMAFYESYLDVSRKWRKSDWKGALSALDAMGKTCSGGLKAYLKSLRDVAETALDLRSLVGELNAPDIWALDLDALDRRAAEMEKRAARRKSVLPGKYAEFQKKIAAMHHAVAFLRGLRGALDEWRGNKRSLDAFQKVADSLRDGSTLVETLPPIGRLIDKVKAELRAFIAESIAAIKPGPDKKALRECAEMEKFIISLGDFGLTSNYRNLESLKTRISLEIGKACDTLYESYQEAVSAEDAEKAGKILEKLLETAPDESKYHAWAAKQLKQMK